MCRIPEPDHRSRCSFVIDPSGDDVKIKIDPSGDDITLHWKQRVDPSGDNFTLNFFGHQITVDPSHDDVWVDRRVTLDPSGDDITFRLDPSGDDIRIPCWILRAVSDAVRHPQRRADGGAQDAGSSDAPQGATEAGNAGGAAGETLIDKLFRILSKLEEKLNGAVEKLGTIKEGDQSGLQKAMFEIQKLQNMMKQVFETITNIQKSNDDTKEAIIRNFA